MIKVTKIIFYVYLIFSTLYNIYLWEFKYTTPELRSEFFYCECEDDEGNIQEMRDYSKFELYSIMYLIHFLLALLIGVFIIPIIYVFLDDKIDEWDKPKNQKLKEKYYKKYKK